MILLVSEYYNKLIYEKDYLLICEKQPKEVLCKKRCSWKFRKIHRKTPVPATLLKKRLWHWCFPVNFAKCLTTPVAASDILNRGHKILKIV